MKSLAKPFALDARSRDLRPGEPIAITNSDSSDRHPSSQLTDQQLERLGEALDDLLVRTERGERVDIDAVCALHPDLDTAIRHYVQSINLLENAASRMRDLPPSRPLLQLESPINVEHRQLGDYQLIREIGRGGMGVVYEALQISLARRVALKILPFAAVLDSRKIARFQNEAQAAASLHHPHIVPVYAVGSDRGTYFYSMQYIDGQPLDFAIAQLQDGHQGSLFGIFGEGQSAAVRNATTLVADSEAVIRGENRSPSAVSQLPLSAQRPSRHRDGSTHAASATGRVSPSTLRMSAAASTRDDARSRAAIQSRDYVRRVAELGVQAADALGHAHQSGIVHRDIKPSNLLIDAEGKLWITDFGLAQCSSLESLTCSGDVMGTLRYMSPEQAAGKSHWIDNRTDIYSLGQTLYELLTLHQAVDGSDRATIMRQIESVEPTAPRQFNSVIPVDLENIILKSISKLREDRYATADDLAADLRRYLAGQTPTARKPSLLDRSARWVSRHARSVAVAGSIVCFGLLAAVAFASILSSKNRQIAKSQAQAEKHLQIANEAVYQFGSGILSRLELLPGSEEVRMDIARQSVGYFEQFVHYASSVSHMHRDVARALMASADIQSQMGNHHEALDEYASASTLLARQRMLHPTNHELFEDWLLCQNNHACAQLNLGEMREAEKLFESGLRAMESEYVKHGDQCSDVAALLHLNLGYLIAQQGDVKRASQQFDQAMAALRAAALQSAGKGIDRSSPAPVLPVPYDRSNAVDALLTAALLQVGQLSLPNITTPIATPKSAGEQTSENSPGQKSESSSRARSIIEQALYVAELRASRNAHSSSAEKLAALHDVALCEIALGSEAAASGRWSSARTSQRRALSVLKELCQLQPRTLVFAHDLATASNNLGQVEMELGQFVAAEHAFRESEHELERLLVLGDDYRVGSSLAGVLNNLAVLKEKSGMRSTAVELLTRAIALQEQALARAPDDARCKDFLNEHRALLARINHE